MISFGSKIVGHISRGAHRADNGSIAARVSSSTTERTKGDLDFVDFNTFLDMFTILHPLIYLSEVDREHLSYYRAVRRICHSLDAGQLRKIRKR